MHEKFMDFAFLNAVMRTSSFPPADPWFAGGFLDFYYYLGYLSIGVLGKLCSVEPSILFNLAIALIFALCFNLFFGFGYNLTSGKVKYGVITAVAGASAWEYSGVYRIHKCLYRQRTGLDDGVLLEQFKSHSIYNK